MGLQLAEEAGLVVVLTQVSSSVPWRLLILPAWVPVPKYRVREYDCVWCLPLGQRAVAREAIQENPGCQDPSSVPREGGHLSEETGQLTGWRGGPFDFPATYGSNIW